MKSDKLSRSITILRIVFGLVIIELSASLLITTLNKTNENWHTLDTIKIGLASVETVAAVLFLLPWTIRIGSILLWLVFAFAFLIHLLHGEFNALMFLYAAIVWVIWTNGLEEK